MSENSLRTHRVWQWNDSRIALCGCWKKKHIWCHLIRLSAVYGANAAVLLLIIIMTTNIHTSWCGCRYEKWYIQTTLHVCKWHFDISSANQTYRLQIKLRFYTLSSHILAHQGSMCVYIFTWYNANTYIFLLCERRQINTICVGHFINVWEMDGYMLLLGPASSKRSFVCTRVIYDKECFPFPFFFFFFFSSVCCSCAVRVCHSRSGKRHIRWMHSDRTNFFLNHMGYITHAQLFICKSNYLRRLILTSRNHFNWGFNMKINNNNEWDVIFVSFRASHWHVTITIIIICN